MIVFAFDRTRDSVQKDTGDRGLKGILKDEKAWEKAVFVTPRYGLAPYSGIRLRPKG